VCICFRYFVSIFAMNKLYSGMLLLMCWSKLGMLTSEYNNRGKISYLFLILFFIHCLVLRCHLFQNLVVFIAFFFIVIIRIMREMRFVYLLCDHQTKQKYISKRKPTENTSIITISLLEYLSSLITQILCLTRLCSYYPFIYLLLSC